MKRMAISTALLLAMLFGCSPEPAQQPDKTRGAPAPSTSRGATPVVPPSTKPAQKVADPSHAARHRKLAVEAEGLRLFDPASGAARTLPFGMERAQLLGILERFRGPADQGTNSECGAGPLDYAVWADGLTLQFQDGRFAGWALDERAEGAHSTASGIGPGSTRRALDAAYQAEVQQTSLGTEFSAGGLSGVLSGPGPEAKVKAMWAGVSCVFR